MWRRGATSCIGPGVRTPYRSLKFVLFKRNHLTVGFNVRQCRLGPSLCYWIEHTPSPDCRCSLSDSADASRLWIAFRPIVRNSSARPRSCFSRAVI